jgi:tetratricopeptide (TPR) repeat protein
LKVSPADAPTWFNLGNLERRAARPDSALALYRTAESADSAFVPGLEAQIQLHRAARREREAIEVYRRWLRQHPDHHGARVEAVRLLDQSGREDDALALAREGTEQVRNSGHPYLILGMVLRGRGDTRGALEALRKAETLFLNHPGERERAAKTIAAMRASAPDSLRAMFAADSVAAGNRRN